jgi:hypothetical protein
MDISPVNAPVFNAPRTNPAPSDPASAPAAPVDETVPMMQGLAGRPPIDNIAQQIQQGNVLSAKLTQTAGTLMAQQVAAQKAQDEKARLERDEDDVVNPLAQDQDLILDMRNTILNKTREVTKNVNRSAFKFMFKKTDWINKEKASEAEDFFTFKVPKVLAEELTRILSEALGLEEVSD